MLWEIINFIEAGFFLGIGLGLAFEVLVKVTNWIEELWEKNNVGKKS